MHRMSLKLNLGSGQHPLDGYVNVDKFGSPDVVWDLEQFPWPWDDNSVDEVLMQHVLEHVGASAETYFRIVKELYRVCRDGATVRIIVPHPRHDDYLGDPTHVRIVTPEGWLLFSKAKNRDWKQRGCSNSPLADYLDVDFELGDVGVALDNAWLAKLRSGEIREDQIQPLARQYNNVIKEWSFEVRVIKPSSAKSAGAR